MVQGKRVCASPTINSSHDVLLQLEDISNQLFTVKAYNVDIENVARPFGVRQPPKMKLLKGFGIALGLIVLIWFPLLIMVCSLALFTRRIDVVSMQSLLNSTSDPNPVISANFQFGVGAYQPMFQGQTISMNTLTQVEYDVLRQTDTTGFISAFGPQDIQRIIFATPSISVWGISPGSYNNLYNDLLSPNISVTSNVLLSFTRAENLNVATDSQQFIQIVLSEALQQNLTLALNASNDITLHIKEVFPQFLHLTVNGYPASDLPVAFNDQLANISLRHISQNDTDFWSLNQTSRHVKACISAVSKKKVNYLHHFSLYYCTTQTEHINCSKTAARIGTRGRWR